MPGQMDLTQAQPIFFFLEKISRGLDNNLENKR